MRSYARPGMSRVESGGGRCESVGNLWGGASCRVSAGERGSLLGIKGLSVCSEMAESFSFPKREGRGDVGVTPGRRHDLRFEDERGVALRRGASRSSTRTTDTSTHPSAPVVIEKILLGSFCYGPGLFGPWRGKGTPKVGLSARGKSSAVVCFNR